MGACDFYTESIGKDAKDAFARAVETARYEYGHGGYTGSIAEKRDFKSVTCPAGVDPTDYAIKLVERGDPLVNDKWGPAGCVELPRKNGMRCFLFFGLASS